MGSGMGEGSGKGHQKEFLEVSRSSTDLKRWPGILSRKISLLRNYPLCMKTLNSSVCSWTHGSSGWSQPPLSTLSSIDWPTRPLCVDQFWPHNQFHEPHNLFTWSSIWFPDILCIAFLLWFCQIFLSFASQNCQRNTTGEHCEKCLDGYIGDSIRGPPRFCQPCPCPLPHVAK